MKKLVTFIFTILLSIAIFAQTPQSFKYQSVVRDANGNVIQNQAVDFRISILQTSSSGTPVYIETFSTTTNNYGLVNLNIGTGTVLSGTFSTINWSADNYFLQVEIDADGNGYQLMGTSQLLSVPYALNAAKADNVNNNDTSATNELQTLSQTGTDVSLSNGGGTISVADNDNDSTNEIQAISFSGDTLYLSNGSSVYLGSYSNIWQQNGNDIYYNNGYVGVGLTDPHGKLIVQGDASIPADSAIFEVRNQNGQVVFAVYQEGVRVYVDDTGTKGISSKGGFAVGGFNATKSLTNEYLRVTPDSVRVYIEEGSGSKAIHSKGGFAIGGFNATKTSFNGPQYFNVSASDTAGIIPMPGEARVMWYPLKEAFLSGHVIIESPDSVGLNSWATGFESKSIGDYSQALGYSARAFGNNSTAIGYKTNAIGESSFAFGTGAKAIGNYSFALGGSGYYYNYSTSSIDTAYAPIATTDYSYAFGMGCISDNYGAVAIGALDTASGQSSIAMGYATAARGDASTAMGYYTKAYGDYSIGMGYETAAIGKYSTAIGYMDTANAYYSTAIGYQSIASGQGATAFGYSTEASGSASTAMGTSTIASGINSMAIGYSTEASGSSSTAMGFDTKASAHYSTSMGMATEASGNSSTAMGELTKASADNSTAMGYLTIASGQLSLATGHQTAARGYVSTTMGYQTIARSQVETVFGRYNDTTASINLTTWADTDPLFIIGNGSDDLNRHNAVTVFKNGNVGINTNTPDKLLTVDGDARITGDIYYGAIGSATIYDKPDFVFKPNYKKDFSFDYIEKYINRHGHLPWLTAAKDEKNGINMTRMSFETLEAVENIQLQIIKLRKEKDEQIYKLEKENLKLKKEKDEQIKKLEKENKNLKSENKEILKRLEKIEKQLKTK